MAIAPPWNDLLTKPGERAHLVQFYKDPAALGRTVSFFLSEGLKRGETVVVIAIPEHWEEFRKGLEARGHDPSRLQQEGRLAVKEARETLAAFMREGMPDAALFRIAIGPVLSALAVRGGTNVRAFGEMVSILWQEGNYDAAIRLEELWNGLAETHEFTLLCAYEGSVLAPEFHGRPAEGIFKEHSHVLPLDYDQLTSAVNRAMDEILGEAEAAALRPLIAASKRRIAAMAGAQASLLWLQTHLPDQVDAVLAAARHHYANCL